MHILAYKTNKEHRIYRIEIGKGEIEMIKRDEMSGETLDRITMPMCEKLVNYETSGDVALPEYLPEIRKILNVSGKIQSPSKYVNGTMVECSGVIDCKLFFLGADGNIFSTSFPLEYEFRTAIDDCSDCELSDGIVTLIGTNIDGIVSRASTPRKVNVKCRLTSRVRCFAKMNMSEELIGEIEEESIERLVEECESVELLSVESEPIEVNEEIFGLGDDIRVISADASAFVSDINRAEGIIGVGGDVYLKILYCKDGDCPKLISKKTRFSGEIESDIESNNYICKVSPAITDIVVNVEDGKVNCTISLVLNAVVAYNGTVRYAEDAYSTERECECRKDNILVPYLLALTNANFSQSERVDLSETNIPQNAIPIDSWGSVYLSSCDRDGEKYVFSGQSKYCILWEKDGEYGACEISLPVKYECMGREERRSYDAIADVVSVRTRVDGDMLCIDAEIAVAYDIMGAREISVVRECRFGEILEKKKRGMIIYYPASNESNWEVAKKYHVEADGLIARNGYYLF